MPWCIGGLDSSVEKSGLLTTEPVPPLAITITFFGCIADGSIFSMEALFRR